MRSLLNKIVDVKPNEMRALGLAFLFNFVILGSYYVIRPIRDDIAAAGSLESLSWMFTGTLVAMLVANALFSAIVARMSRRKFIPIAYRFFMANLVLFYLLMRTAPPAQSIWIGRAFYIWVSVFNLFVVTLFWAFMTDVFNTEQAKRLFALISVGGSLGAIVGPIITVSLVRQLGAANLILLTAALLELGPWCVKFFPTGFAGEHAPLDDRPRADQELTDAEVSQQTPAPSSDADAEKPIGGSIVSGISHVIQSPYLLGICAFMLLHAVTSTLAYFQQADITGHQFHDRAARTAFFAQLDLSVNLITVVVQLFLTGRLLKWFGVGWTLVLMPALSMAGFVAMGCVPMLTLLALFQVMRRAANFAVTRPAREVLFTVLRREDKYKAKSFIDTFVYRAGDQIGAWSYRGLHDIGLGMRGISFVATPLALIWCGLSLWLGRKQVALAKDRETSIA